MSHRIPTYRKKKTKTGTFAAVTLPDGLGGRRDVLLGKYGTKESRQEYARVIAEWEANGHRPAASRASDLTINEVLVHYLKHVEAYYRHPDGTETSEVKNIKNALRPLKELYGSTIAARFDPSALEAVRLRMMQANRCRSRINKDTARIKRTFKWAAAKQLVPSSIWHDLQTVEGLRAGRSKARETAPVGPVPRATVEVTLPHLPAVVADMVQLQLETGMRPGEVAILRACDVDMTGSVWLYRPAKYKTQHHGHSRVVPLGPRAQEIIRRRLKINLEDYLVSPQDSMAEFRAKQRQKRKTPVQPSQVNRKKRRPKRRPSSRYTVSSYGQAIGNACEKAFPAPDHLRPRAGETKKAWRQRLTEADLEAIREWRHGHRWHPHQLRHLRALELKREVGLDVTRAVLGHRSPIITEHYATLDMATAAEAMARLG